MFIPTTLQSWIHLLLGHQPNQKNPLGLELRPHHQTLGSMAGRRPLWGLPGVGMSSREQHLSPSLQGVPPTHPWDKGPCSPLLSSCGLPTHPCCVSFAAQLTQIALPKSQKRVG